ncbi:Putative thioesterase (yiiD_Cterm) [Planctomycetes bacterium MalM25]|nr:Putative thioesterase (yiiD_Cterm) [Planctomycetes bacterium MalM25]
MFDPPLLPLVDQAAEHCRRVEELVRAEIPLSAQMEVGVDRLNPEGLWLSMPLEPNLNPHQTAFAGSLNALCTLAGWAMTHLLLEQLGVSGSTVLRRSSVKYREPVESPRVVAHCLPPREADWTHFAEMLRVKGQAKLDHVVEIAGANEKRPAVLFAGSYVAVRHD